MSSGPCQAAGGGLREAFFVEYPELIHRLLPIVLSTHPVGRDVAQSQPDQLGGYLVAWEVPVRLDDLSQLRVDAFQRIRGVDHAPYRRWEREERDHLVPRPPPRGRDGGEPGTLRALLERVQFDLRGLGTGGRLDRLDCRGQRLAVLPAGVVQAAADQVQRCRSAAWWPGTPLAAPLACP